MKYYSPTGRRNQGRHLKTLLDTWDRNGSTSGLTPWQIYDYDDDDDDCVYVAWVIQHTMRIPRFILWSAVCSNTIFFHIISQMARFTEKNEHKMCIFIFLQLFFSEAFLNLRRKEQDMIKNCILVFMWSVRYSCSILMKLELLDRFFKQYLYITFQENPSSGSRVFFHADRQTWRS
jgi:hypothetical protein